MPKRSTEEKILHYNKKIRKLEQSVHKRRGRIVYSPDPEDFSDQSVGQEPISGLDLIPEAEPLSEPQPGTSDAPVEATAAEQPDTVLDPELLSALGECTSGSPEFGPNVHESLAKLWTPLLKKGMSKENKEQTLKQYLIPGNCKLLQSPKLNDEISVAVSEVVRGRDKKLQAFQQQLGIGITAVNQGMDVLLKSDNKVQALKHLSDGCRILSDLHYSWTKDRTKLITPSLDKKFQHVIQDLERDETLFSSTLSDKIKASKAIEKQGLQIKKTVPKFPAAPQSTVTRPANQGNWSGPSRYLSNRGGRGGQRKPAPAPRRGSYHNAPTTRPIGQSKPHAPART